MGCVCAHVCCVDVCREKVTIMASQRRMERRLKDLNATLDQERNQSAEQKDQVEQTSYIDIVNTFAFLV